MPRTRAVPYQPSSAQAAAPSPILILNTHVTRARTGGLSENGVPEASAGGSSSCSHRRCCRRRAYYRQTPLPAAKARRSSRRKAGERRVHGFSEAAAATFLTLGEIVASGFITAPPDKQQMHARCKSSAYAKKVPPPAAARTRQQKLTSLAVMSVTTPSLIFVTLGNAQAL